MTVVPVPTGRSRGLSLGDRQGLTAAGGVALALVAGLAGGAFDVLTGSGLRLVFAGCFVAGCALAAAFVHREDLTATVVMPPLVYLVLILAGAAVEGTIRGGSFLTRQALELVNAVILGAPVLLAATGAALLVSLFRWWLGRS